MPEADALFNFVEHIELNMMPQMLFASDNLSDWDFFILLFLQNFSTERPL